MYLRSTRYPGSDEYRVLPIPMAQVIFRDRIYLGPSAPHRSAWRAGRLAEVGLGAILADARQMRREFGISQSEASRRQALIDEGDDRLQAEDGRAYRPEGGLRSVGASASVVHLLSLQW